MQSRVPLLLASLFALAAGAFGLYILLAGPRSEPLAAGAPAAAPGPGPSRTGRAEEGLRGVGDDAEFEREVATRSVLEAAAPTTAPFELATASWVDVRVVLPPGTPADEELELHALSPPPKTGESEIEIGAEQLAGLLLRPEAGGSRGLEQLRESARVVLCERTPQGSFRAPFAADATEGMLLFSGHYLFLREPRAVAPETETAVTLEPELGGRLLAHFRLPQVPPAGFSEERMDPLMVQVMGWAMGNTREPHRAAAMVGPELTADVGGLPADLTYFLQVESEWFVELSDSMLRVEPGRALQKSYQLVTGATVRGRVTDDSGAPLAGAQVAVEGSRSGGMVFGRGTDRGTVTDADGRFELRALAPGENSLSAVLGGYAHSAALHLELSDLQQVDEVVIVLPRGNRISGRLSWPDGRAAAEGRVELTERVSAEDGKRTWHSDQNHNTTTDQEGRFSVTGLGDGPFDLRAEVSTASAPRPSVEGGLVNVQHTETWRARAEGVLPGAEVALVLERPIAVLGRVVDDLGAPVTKFVVKAGEAEQGDLPWRVVAESSGDPYESADGTFALTRLGRGSWTLSVEAEGHGSSEERSLTLPGDSGPFTFTLPRAGSVSGVVLDPLGRAAAGASVSLRPAGRIGRWSDDSEETESDPQGAFRFEAISPSVIELRASREGAASSEPVTLDLAAAAVVEDKVLVLRVGGRLTGEVYRDDGSPDAGRQVMVGQPMEGMGQHSVVTDGAGRFEVEHLEPGSLQVIAMPEMQNLATSEDRAEMMSQLEMASVEIQDGGSAHVVLGAPPAYPVSLTGVVRSAGRPAPDQIVMAVVEGGAFLNSMKFARTASDGTFALTLPAPGDWVLLVGEEMDNDASEFPIRVPEEETHHVELAIPGGSISGVVRGPDGALLSGEQVSLASDSVVSLFGQSGGREGVTDERGRFTFVNLRVGSYTLRAGQRGDFFMAHDQPDYATVVVSGLELEDGAALDGIELRLCAPGTLRGTVRSAQGEPVVDASVFVRNEAGAVLNPMSMCITDGKGAFRFESAAPGRYTLSARGGGGASRESAPVSVAEGAEVEVELVLEPGTLLVVSVEDAKGNSLRAHLRVWDEAGRDVAGLSESDAREKLLVQGFSASQHRVGPLVPGRYRVVATTADGSSAEKSVTLAGRDERRLRIRLEHGG